MSKELALAAKARGNAAFGKGDFKVAIEEFTEAIKQDPTDHVFFSNRSGAHASLGNYEEALNDANKCVEIKPTWAKGYSRKGLPLLKLKKFEEAKEAYEAGLKIDPANAACKDGLKDIERAMSSGGPGGGLGSLFGEQMWTRLATDPVTREYLNDPSFRQKLQMLQTNPNMMSSFMGDPKMSAAMGVILGLGSSGFQTAKPGEFGEDAEEEPTKSKPMDAEPTPEPEVEVEEAEEEEAEEIEAETEEEKAERLERQAQEKAERLAKEAEEKKDKENAQKAASEKTLGNAAYKKKDFETALVHYNKAAEIDPKSAVYHNNMAAVYLEMKEYDKCVEKCKEAIELEKKRPTYDFTLVSKSWVRIGNAYDKAGKLAESEDAYQTALMEDYSDAAKKNLKRVKAKRQKMEQESYINPELSEQHKDKGNKFFQEGKWQDAIEEYSEALKRNPKNYKVYSNRAACFTKLMAWNDGLNDCEACLKIDPGFVKAYIRKGKIEHFLKKYHVALQTFDKGLALDPKCTDLLEARALTMRKINEENAQGVDPERAKEAMKDPEIQNIMRDPMVQHVLQNMQENPAAAQAAFNDPSMRSKLEKLIAAGIVRMA